MQALSELYQHFLSCRKISTDTRKDIKGSIYFALSGDNFNGNKFAKDALDKGASLVIVDQEVFKINEKCFLVENTLHTLQDLARLHRSTLNCKFIGITGSNGKTTTKELISLVLSSEKKVSYTQGNLNNHIGVPLTILNISDDTEIAVIEMGANHIGEIAFLCDIARPQTGIITNIGKAHLEGFGSFEGVIEAKSELYDFLRNHDGMAIVNGDDPLLLKLAEGLERITYGSSSELFTAEIIASKPYLNFKWTYQNQEFLCETKLYGKYNMDNIRAAIAFGLYEGISPEHINDAISAYQPDNNRSQLLDTESNRIILDAYNANPVSMSNAIESFREYQAANPWLLLGDMFELGDAAAKEHKKIIHLLQENGFENVILVGNEFFKLRSTTNFPTFLNLQEAASHLINHPIRNAQVLVKGSRGVQLEKLLKFL
ncbi:MAG: UDP-N-acetylmuramoyl-tripeptide--D-alanyl-D-alanine ligase [Marinilabiliales bacterium]|nr:MAG: UDP-N-acetylmuramoyl-tripeptide--D-alanyl-D-alanine ligase [Marinilabiliales bacterium]